MRSAGLYAVIQQGSGGVRFIQPVVDRDAARERLQRRRFDRLRRWARALVGALPRPNRSAGDAELRQRLPHLELVWLPRYRITIEAATRTETRRANVLIDARDGQATLIDLTDVSLAAHPEAETYAPRLDEHEAVQIARSTLVTAILRSPGWSSKPKIGQTLDVELLQYPLWAYTFERRRGRLDLKVLDAVTGSPGGPKTKATLLAAFVEARGTPTT